MSKEPSKSKEMFHVLVEQSLQGVIIIDKDFRIAFANAAMAKIAGYTIEEMLSLLPEKVRGLVHPKDQKLVWERFQNRINGNTVTPHYEFRGVQKNGEIRWLEMFASPIIYRGKPAIYAAIIDISPRKKTEDALIESEKRYRNLFEEMKDALYISNI